MFWAWPLSGRSPVAGSTSAYLTDELPELSTRTRPAEPGEPAMAGMLPVAGYGRVRRPGRHAVAPGRIANSFGIITGRGRPLSYHVAAVLLRGWRPLRTSVLVPLVGVLAVATTWFGLYPAVIARWTP